MNIAGSFFPLITKKKKKRNAFIIEKFIYTVNSVPLKTLGDLSL